MKELFCSYSQAKELKELSMDIPCFATFNMEKVPSGFPNENMAGESVEPLGYVWQNSKIHKDTISAPLKQQVFSWFREKHDLHSWITRELGMNITFCWVITGENQGTIHKSFYKTYEQAESECIDKLISILKEKNNENTYKNKQLTYFSK
jgi:hypothetical protein